MRVSFSGSIEPLENSIAYTFRNKTLLKEALTHKSFSNEKENKGSPFNERLEFLGDAVLTLVISRYLYSAYPEYSESELSKIRAYVVQESSLSDAAKGIDIGTHLRLGKGEDMTGGREKSSLLANAFEALLGAIYLDGGIRKAESFVIRHLKGKINELASGDLQYDFKTRLQEVSQARFGVLPRYITEHEEGPEHRKTFEVKVFIKNVYYGSGTGGSKKAAAQRAAQAGLKKLDGFK
jgi:ribonuclease-3